MTGFAVPAVKSAAAMAVGVAPTVDDGVRVTTLPSGSPVLMPWTVMVMTPVLAVAIDATNGDVADALSQPKALVAATVARPVCEASVTAFLQVSVAMMTSDILARTV